jgi:radical SAM protein with 4Fe4S-binding SPASM domain
VLEQVITLEERLQIERQNRLLLEEELLDKRLEFRSRPYEAHIQYSNFCNMSCVMCYNGEHPPVARMSPELLAKVREELAPHLSVVIPYDGSEPLLLTWDEAREMAEQYSIDLRITTNVQFLDEQKFHELKDITETLFLSIDSHNREIFERIRPGSNPDKVFENLASAARLSREHGVECIAQVVFMIPNASLLPETVAYLADVGASSVNVLQLIDINGQSGFLDPMLHLSAEYIEWVKQRCIDVAREKRSRFMWGIGGFERHDFRDEKVPPNPRKDWNVRWDRRMKHLVPGYCMNVYDRLQVHVNGQVDPCAYATDGELRLGSLLEQDFEEIWNGPNARDLRRAMVTWDYPSLCKSCQYTDLIGPENCLPFVADVMRELGRPRGAVACTLHAVAPEHMTRVGNAPSIAIATPREPVERYLLALALGGESELELCELEPAGSADGRLEFELPEDVWSRLRTNLGYWWAIFGLVSEAPRVLRTSEIRCLIRHEEMPRISGSTLSYPDEGRLPVVDLGGYKQAGWKDRRALPVRPALAERRLPFVAPRRLVQQPNDLQPPPTVSKAEYRRLVEQIRSVVAEALPADATIAVVSKGDGALLNLDCAEAWHFPASADGGYAEHHPPDSEWAREQLEAMRAKGADYLLFPATSMWWLTYYSEFADHIWRHYPAVMTDAETCTIFAIGPTPALYGRERDVIVNAHLHPGDGS